MNSFHAFQKVSCIFCKIFKHWCSNVFSVPTRSCKTFLKLNRVLKMHFFKTSGFYSYYFVNPELHHKKKTFCQIGQILSNLVLRKNSCFYEIILINTKNFLLLTHQSPIFLQNHTKDRHLKHTYHFFIIGDVNH